MTSTPAHNPIQVGRMLRAGLSGFIAGCRVAQLETPRFAALVRAPLGPDYDVFGMIANIYIDDDGLVRQLVTAENIDQAIIADNRVNRNIPVEMSVISVGYRLNGVISHLLPPRPPLSLDEIVACTPQEVVQFTVHGQFGYFRHILRTQEAPVGELLASHLEDAQQAHSAAGDPLWISRAAQELITQLRDDYPTLMSVLGALRDTRLELNHVG